MRKYSGLIRFNEMTWEFLAFGEFKENSQWCCFFLTVRSLSFEQ